MEQVIWKELNISSVAERRSDLSCPKRRGRDSVWSPGGREDSPETPCVLSSAEGSGVGKGTWEWALDLCPAPAPSRS